MCSTSIKTCIFVKIKTIHICEIYKVKTFQNNKHIYTCCVSYSNSSKKMLKSPYFEHVGDKYHGNLKYSSYITKYPALVLYNSNTGQALSSIQLITPDSGNALLSARTLLDLSSSTNDVIRGTAIQGIVGTSGQAIQVVLTNFLEKGYENINLLRQDIKVDKVDPGPQFGINELNEISPLNYYVVKCDQLNNRELLVNGISIFDGTKTHKLTVQQDEEDAKKNNTKKQAMELFVSVLPQSGIPGIESLFKNTIWRISQGVILFEKSMLIPDGRSGGDRVRLFNSDARMLNIPRGDYYVTSTEATLAEDATSIQDTNRNHFSAHDEDDDYDDFMCRLKSKKKKSKGHVYIPEVKEVDIMSSNAATFGYGRQISKEITKTTNTKYCYNLQSPKCIISFSVLESVMFQNYSTSSFRKLLIDHLEAECHNLIQDSGKEMFKKTKIFKSGDTCCYCLEADPTIVIFTCGHQASCAECFKDDKSNKCAICRGVVFGTFNVTA